jgi:hypothetical protein
MNETETVLSKKLLEKIQKAKALVAEGKILRYQNEKGHIEEFRAFPSKSKNFNMEPYVVTPRSCSCIDWRVTHAS